MGDDSNTVQVTAADIGAAIPLAEPLSEASVSYRVTTLDLMAKQPSRLGRMFSGGGGISVTVDPSPVPGGAPLWATQVRFPKGTNIDQEFARAGLAWPVWWAIPDMTHLVESARILEFVAFAPPQLALPWFVRLHAAATGCDPLGPVVVKRTVSSPMRPEHDQIDDIEDLVRDVNRAELSEDLMQSAYAAWQRRAAEQPH